MSKANDAKQYGLEIGDLLPILDSVGESIFIDNAEGYALWINKACEDIYRITKEEIIGKHCSYLEETGIFVPSVARQVMEKKEEITILHKNRDGKQLLSTGIPLFDEKGMLSKIITTSHDITELAELQNRLESMQSALQGIRVGGGPKYEGIIANSPVMLNVIQMAERLAPLDTTVLITGESGSGKGVIAKLLHEIGNRRDRPFIQINCGAIPANLLESELFGYERGAFTGSRKEGKKGLFEAAKSGTVFLDEIAELPLNMQVKILQVIQEKAVQRVGGLDRIPVDVRIISATNRNLEQMVRDGRFREDLFYRLNVVPIAVPPLRGRPEDIIPMIRTFLQENNKKFNENKTMDTEAMAALLKYGWPGNVRELENIIERLVITTKGGVIGAGNLPNYIHDSAGEPEAMGISRSTGLQEALDALERQMLVDAKAKYKTTREIAKALDISQPTVVRKLAKYGL